MASTWFTTLTAIREASPDWEAIACYREPIARFLERVFPSLGPDLREDIVQDVLCAMRTSVVSRFDPDRGRFRDYLRGVIRNQARQTLRARRQAGGALPLDPDGIPELEPDDVEAVDLGGRLVRAVRDFHDATLRGPDAERQVLYCLSDRLVDGLSYAEIAAKEELSQDAVKRRLQAARRGILRALLRTALADARLELPERRLSRAADAVAKAVPSRRPPAEVSRDVLGRRADAQVRAVVEDLVASIRTGVRWFPGLDSPDGQAFVSALRSVLEGDADRGPP